MFLLPIYIKRIKNMENKFREKDLQGRAHFSQDFDKYYYTAGTEDDYDKIDVYATAKTQLERTYAIEIKDYTNSGIDRPYDKYNKNGFDNGYQIDYEKLDYLCKEAAETNRIPILYVRFTDYTIVWRLDRIDWKGRESLVLTNKNGQDYGAQKEWSRQTYLYKTEAVWIKKTS